MWDLQSQYLMKGFFFLPQFKANVCILFQICCYLYSVAYLIEISFDTHTQTAGNLFAFSLQFFILVFFSIQVFFLDVFESHCFYGDHSNGLESYWSGQSWLNSPPLKNPLTSSESHRIRMKDRKRSN